MSKLAKAFLVVALLWVIVYGAGYFAWGRIISFIPNFVQVNHKAQSEEVITQSASDISLVSVDTKNGSVTFTAVESTDITIKAFYTAYAGLVGDAESRLKELKTQVSTTGGTLNVVGVFPSTTISNQSIRYEVSLPKNLDVKVKTSNGGITVKDAEGKLDLRTSNGTVDVSAVRGPKELLVSTSNGRINVAAAPTAGIYDLRTSNGSVTVTLPEALGVDLTANTSNGSINLGYGQWSFSGGQVSSKSVSAQLGNGALTLDIKTSNGSIRLEKN